MPRPFKSKSKATALREQAEAHLDDLAAQAHDLRRQAIDRAPAVRDQLKEMLPDKEQLLDLRDDLFDRLPDTVQDKLPEQVKPKRSRFKRVAVFGLITGAGAAAFAVLRGRSKTTPARDPFPQQPPAPPAAPTPTPTPKSTSTATGVGLDGDDLAAEPTKKAAPEQP